MKILYCNSKDKLMNIPVIITKQMSQKGRDMGYSVEIPDNFMDYNPSKYEDINFEDFCYHLPEGVGEYDIESGLYLFPRKKECVSHVKSILDQLKLEYDLYDCFSNDVVDVTNEITSEPTQSIIDEKIKKLMCLTTRFLFIEYYPHTGEDMYKILNPYTKYAQEKIVLCRLSDGIEMALDFAINELTKAKN